jgi:hypothetical protein
MNGTVSSPFLYDATDVKLERFFLLGAFVAGKHAGVQQRKLDGWLQDVEIAVARVSTGPMVLTRRPLDMLRALWQHAGSPVITSGAEAQNLVKRQPVMVQLLQENKVGQYVRLSRFLFTVARLHAYKELDLCKATREQLIELPGYGLKSASFFLLFTRQSQQLACLDTHILQYMQRNKLARNIPKTTPSGDEYLRLEQVFLRHCEKLGRLPAELDFEIWKENSVTMRGQKFLTEL